VGVSSKVGEGELAHPTRRTPKIRLRTPQGPNINPLRRSGMGDRVFPEKPSYDKG